VAFIVPLLAYIGIGAIARRDVAAAHMRFLCRRPKMRHEVLIRNRGRTPPNIRALRRNLGAPDLDDCQIIFPGGAS
jgi:hypothetical protein